MIAIIALSVLMGILPVIPWEVAKNQNQAAEASYLTIEPYPLLDWSKPEPAIFVIVLNEGTKKEEIISSEGEQSLAESSSDISSQIFSFYDASLKQKGFIQKKVTNDPKKDKYWVVSYTKGSHYFEVQYYPTPYEKNTFTILVFFGVPLREGKSL